MNARQIVHGLRPFLIDVVAPIVAYFGLRALGVADLPALLLGGGIAAADALVSSIVHRRIRGLPIFVCCTFAMTGALAYLTGDPRMMLLKASFASAAIGLYLLVLAAFPATLGPILAPLIARGSDDRASRWRTAWGADASIRRTVRFASLLAGLAILLEAAARAVIVFNFTIGQSLFLAHGPAIILVIALVLILRRVVTPAVARAMAGAETGENQPIHRDRPPAILSDGR